MFSNFWEKVLTALVEKGRYLYIIHGLGNTVLITLGALLLGVIIGLLISAAKVAPGKSLPMRGLRGLADIYLTIIRGTPSTLQLMIIYFVILAPFKGLDKVMISAIAFGINSGAYVAEIIRAGILAVDRGQMEAGRSLGLGYNATMRRIILPQAFKNILPALGNELITLLKETSIAGYIGTMELTKGADIIKSQTYEPLVPLLVAGAIYLVIVMFLTWALSKLEGRLRKSDHR